MDITTVAYMPIEQLMANRSVEKEISGQKLWCGSLVVISYMLQNFGKIINPNSIVIELGAGTGALGIFYYS